MLKNKHYWRIGLLVGTILAVAVLALGIILLQNRLSQPREAPEAEIVLASQAGVPFQVLIPAYLPGGFKRNQVEISTDQAGPLGEPMASLTYTTRAGIELTLSEWIPGDAAPAGLGGEVYRNQAGGVKPCNCMCTDQKVCSIAMLMVEVGSLRIMGETSDPNVLSLSLLQSILSTLAPASGLLVYSTIADVPLIHDLPPAVDVPVGSSGNQEVVLVISEDGYTPIHFSVKKGIPVKLTFKQYGEVGCGNELWFDWGGQQPGHLLLSSSGDQQVLEFTPQHTGDFLFHCPHYIYNGVMTVVD